MICNNGLYRPADPNGQIGQLSRLLIQPGHAAPADIDMEYVILA